MIDSPIYRREFGLTITHDHWLDGAVRCPSSNFNQRPSATDISLLVIHAISLPRGQFGGPFIEQLFTNCLDCSNDPGFADLVGVEVSAHLLIRRTGDIVQFVPFDKRAWHAGVSAFCGRENCNDFSIGIELEGDEQTAYTDAQYGRLAEITRELRRCYPAIQPDAIVGHSDIAPGRKTDPGVAFDWDRYRKLISTG